MLVDIESLFRITFVYRFRTMKSLGAGPISTFPFFMGKNSQNTHGSKSKGCRRLILSGSVSYFHVDNAP